jgi:hypothetical protein
MSRWENKYNTNHFKFCFPNDTNYFQVLSKQLSAFYFGTQDIVGVAEEGRSEK